MTREEFEIRLEDTQIITEFMNHLAEAYTAQEFKGLWQSMTKYLRRFGRHFVASVIRKYPESVSIELYKDFKGFKRKWEVMV